MRRSARLWRGYLYVLAWSAGTACAAAIAWQGVDNVYGHGAGRENGGVIIAVPRGVAAGRPSPGTTPARRPPMEHPGRTSRTSPPPAPRSARKPPAWAGTGMTQTLSYRLTGGIVQLAQSRTSARLAAAMPATGWRKQFWNGEGWLRVDFTKGDHVATLIATWNGHPPEIRYHNNP